MKKRKILAMLMTATLSVGLLAGCGTDNAKEETQNTEEKTDEPQKRTLPIQVKSRELTRKFPVFQTVRMRKEL